MNENNFLPCQILKVYHREYKNEYYIEIHDVQKDPKTKKLSIGAGKPLSKKTLQRLVSASNDDKSESFFNNYWLNHRILSLEPIKYKRHILWYCPACTQSILFSDEKNLKSGFYKMPALLFFVHMDKFRVFAMKTANRRPSLTTELYHAPLFNSSSENTLCWGNVKLYTDQINEIDLEMKAWEKVLWNSFFSYHSVGITKKTSLIDIYKKLKNTDLAFPANELVKTNMTIKDLLNKYLS